MGWLDDLEVVADKGLEWKQRAVDAEAERDQLRTTVAGLRRALEEARQFARDAAYGASIHAADSAICDSARRAEDTCNSALDRTPAQSLDQVKAKVLRGAAEGLINMATTVESNRSYPCGWEACVTRLLEIADQLDRQAEAELLEKEAANGR